MDSGRRSGWRMDEHDAPGLAYLTTTRPGRPDSLIVGGFGKVGGLLELLVQVGVLARRNEPEPGVSRPTFIERIRDEPHLVTTAAQRHRQRAWGGSRRRSRSCSGRTSWDVPAWATRERVDFLPTRWPFAMLPTIRSSRGRSWSSCTAVPVRPGKRSGAENRSSTFPLRSTSSRCVPGSRSWAWECAYRWPGARGVFDREPFHLVVTQLYTLLPPL